MLNLDFIKVASRVKKGVREIYPKLIINYDTRDIMFRGGGFYAIWDPINNIWSTKESVALYLIDSEVDEAAEKYKLDGEEVRVLHMWDAENGMIDKWKRYCERQMGELYHELDETIIFGDAVLKREDYASKKLPYSLEDKDCPAFKELIGVLYSEEERRKIEWAIGAVVSGEAKKIQKFIVMYGAPKTGKSTILNIIQAMFKGYDCVFDAKALGSVSNAFALEPFAGNPLIAVQHDGDLSRIEDNTRLNSIVSHETMVVNEKFKRSYTSRFNCMLFIGTNKPVRITDAKSGIIRRLIDVNPTGKTVPGRKYDQLMAQIKFEYGAIAKYCLDIFKENPKAYENYIPVNMLGASNDFYNYVLDSFDIFEKNDEVTLKSAWELYKVYCDDANVSFPYSKRAFKEELKNYFDIFEDPGITKDGIRVRNLYKKFLGDKYENKGVFQEPPSTPDTWIEFKEQPSVLDIFGADWPAQYSKEDGTPISRWTSVKTKLKDIDTKKEHYVLGPDELIFMDFDLKDEQGNKNFKKNLEAASKFPRTYAELSKSGAGIHLYYIYDGDPNEVATLFDKDIEIKKCTGNSSIRRRLTQCTNDQIAHIGPGLLPLKEKKKVLKADTIKSEIGLRKMIIRCLEKEFGSTRQNINFLQQILDDAYESGIRYDVTNMKKDIVGFAARSSHQSAKCLDIVSEMKFHSADIEESVEDPDIVNVDKDEDEDLVFFDLEVFQNLIVLCYKRKGSEVMALINPTAAQIEQMVVVEHWKFVGFNCLKYDNHIMYALLLGWDHDRIYRLSQQLIGNVPNSGFWQSKDISYTDIFDFSSEKKSLKKFEIELGIHHQELGLPWDKPVPKELIPKVVEYCKNDVEATEAVFYARKGDWVARKILAEIAGMSVNDTTNNLTARIIFGTERHPQLVYTDLATGERSDGTKDIVKYPGYEMVFDENNKRHNMYRGEDAGFGGYVWAKPGMYSNVWVFDVSSMHPNSAIQLRYFGENTERFKELVNARLAIKHKDFDTAKTLMGGVLKKFLVNPDIAKSLSQALKIAINAVYGLTSASFDNPFHDNRNKNNIVALRGALFMIDLKNYVEEEGGTVIHIKTDSIKVIDPTDDLKNKIMEFGKKYGYTFEIENIYERMCLVNDAVYIAKHSSENRDDPGKWEAVGTQFQVPYVFKTLFSHEPIEFKDLCETRSTNTALYLDLNEGYPDVSEYVKEFKKVEKALKNETKELMKGNGSKEEVDRLAKEKEELSEKIAKGHNYQFVGKTGLFCPVVPGSGGGALVRVQGDGFNFVTGTSGYLWLESEIVQALNKASCIDERFYRKLVDDAVETIKKYGDYEWFVA